MQYTTEPNFLKSPPVSSAAGSHYWPFEYVETLPRIADVQHTLTGRVWRQFIDVMQSPELVFRPTRTPHRYDPQIEFSNAENREIERLRMYRIAESQPKRWNVFYTAPATVCRAMAGRETEIIDNGIVPIPNVQQNAAVCRRLVGMFGRRSVLAVPGFMETQIDLNDDGPIVSHVRIDIDARHSRLGFMMPVLVSGEIAGIRVFRSVDDNHSFILRTRGDRRW